MSYTKDLVIDEMNRIDEEETTDSLFRLRAILLAKESELVSIAEKCNTFLEFKNILKKWFKEDEVSVSRDEMVKAWSTSYLVEDLTTMRKED